MNKRADLLSLGDALLRSRIAKEKDEQGVVIGNKEDATIGLAMADLAIDDVMKGKGERLPDGLCDRLLGDIDDIYTSQEKVASAVEAADNSAATGKDDHESCCCRICGYRSGNIKRHLADAHKLDVVDYTNVFPTARVKSEAVGKAYASRSTRR